MLVVSMHRCFVLVCKMNKRGFVLGVEKMLMKLWEVKLL